MSRSNPNARLYLIFILFILGFTYLFSRLAYVQVFKSAQFVDIAREQHHSFTEVAPQRGELLDRNLKKLAVNTVSYSIFATKRYAPNGSKEIEAKLSALLNQDQGLLAEKLHSDKNFVWLKRQVSPGLCAQIKDLNIPGIGEVREHKRFYPNSTLASHIVGFTDIDSRGLEGVELYADAHLAGIKGWRLSLQDAKRRELICWGYKSILPSDGYNIVLTIDSVIQSIAERQLRQAAVEFKATSATAIVLQPKTGEILALCNYPDYDLNNFAEFSQDAHRNLAITDIFEPGSSFKFITAAAALEENKVKLKDKFFCENGEYNIGGRILHDYRPYGELSFQEVIEHSSNIGMAKVAQRLGGKSLYNYIKRFGFGSLTEVDLPGEVKGIVRPPHKWSKSSLTSICMGQEVAVTPLQLITAVSCIANEGVLVRPKILKSIQSKDNRIIKDFPTDNVRRVVSSQTARAVTEALTGCVEIGTGKKAKIPGYKTAGKTGTAQKAKPRGGYYKNKYVASFVGFVGKEEPIIAILVVLNEPSPVYFGGMVCAPVFREIASETLRYLDMTDEAKRVN